MSEDEDCDDLPMISVNTSASGSSMFAMPSAEEVALQRAHELECEEKLLRLRERDLADQRQEAALAAAAAGGAALAHSDSSGSEGDVQLAAAIIALNVQAAAPAAAPAPPAAALWAALAPRLPPSAESLQHRLHGPAQLDYIVDSVAASLASEAGVWADEEVLCACALLCVAMLAHESRNRRAAARAMHALLDDHATVTQESELAILLLSSFPSTRTRLQLSDALRSGGDAGADRLAAALACATMLQLLEPEPAPDSAADWRALLRRADLGHVARAAAAWRQAEPAAAYACVQLAGRVLAATDPALAAAGPALAAAGPALAAAGPALAAADLALAAADPALAATDPAPTSRGARIDLLAHLAPPPAAGLKFTPDRVKVVVSASKLKLLFRTEQ